MSILDMFRLDGQKAVVTGAGKGIGRGIAIGLAEAGADVVIAARTQADIQEVLAEVRARGRAAHAVAIDVTCPGEQERLAAEAQERLGGLTIWVNNAGGLPDATPRLLLETPEESWDAQIDLNLKAVWAGAAAAARRMREGGAIINISSGSSVGPRVRNGPYSAAKAAVNSLTATLAYELAPRIRVNAVAPGPILTPNFIHSAKVTPDNRDQILKQIGVPMGRWGQPMDVAAAVVYLASPAAQWVMGQVFFVTGGRP